MVGQWIEEEWSRRNGRSVGRAVVSDLVWDEEHDVGLQRALQLDCEMHSSPMRPTVCAPSVIEFDDAVDFNSSHSKLL